MCTMYFSHLLYLLWKHLWVYSFFIDVACHDPIGLLLSNLLFIFITETNNGWGKRSPRFSQTLAFSHSLGQCALCRFVSHQLLGHSDVFLECADGCTGWWSDRWGVGAGFSCHKCYVTRDYVRVEALPPVSPADCVTSTHPGSTAAC